MYVWFVSQVVGRSCLGTMSLAWVNKKEIGSSTPPHKILFI